MHTQRVAVAVAAGAGVVCTFLPWLNAPFIGAIDGTTMKDGLGWITFTLCAVALLCALSGNRDNPFPPGAKAACALIGIVVCVIALVAISEITDLTGGELRVGSRYGVGIGLYLLIAAGAGITLSPAIASRSGNRPSSNSAP